MHHPTGTAHRAPAPLLQPPLPQPLLPRPLLLEAEPLPQMARVAALPDSSAMPANAAASMDGAELRQITAELVLLLPQLALPLPQVLPAQTVCAEEALGLDALPVNAVASMAIVVPAPSIVAEPFSGDVWSRLLLIGELGI